jgi:hypothetical protein
MDLFESETRTIQVCGACIGTDGMLFAAMLAARSLLGMMQGALISTVREKAAETARYCVVDT